MGVSFSCLTEGDGSPQHPGLGDIPENCIANVFMYLSPPEIARLARMNRTFKGAASVDFVWELKLPSNYRYLIEKLFPMDLEDWSKKEIYGLLSKPIFFDDGTKEVWLDKFTGEVCMSISSKAMTITGIEDRRYWNFIPTEESRFHVVAYLQQVWWFEVAGELEFQFPTGTYSLFFRVHLGRMSKRFYRRHCNYDLVHGWDIRPVRFQLFTSDGQHTQTQCYLEESEKNGTTSKILGSKRGSWIDYHVGDFVVSNSGSPFKIKYSMTQIDCTHTKGGLCVDSIYICPKKLAGMKKN